MDLSESTEVEAVSTPDEHSSESRHDAISKAFEAADVTEEVTETEAQKTERQRDEKGKFAKTEAAPETAEPEKPKRAYPKSWKPEYSKDFDGIPETVYNEIQRRESDIENGFKRIEQIKGFYDEMNSVINPYLPTINALGVKPSEAVKSLLNADHVLRTGSPEQKAMYFQKLAKNYGVDTTSLPKDENPQYSQLTDKISQLEHQIQSYQQQSQSATLSPYINELNQFASDPAHSHFEELRPVMAALIESGAAADLSNAYEQALWTRPDLRDQQLAEQRKSWQEEEKQRVAKAKAAAVSVKGAPSDSTSTNNPHDRRAQIEAAMNASGR